MSESHLFLQFLPLFLDSFKIQSHQEVICDFWDQNSFKCGVFHGKLVLFLEISYFSGIIQIFRGLFELDMLL